MEENKLRNYDKYPFIVTSDDGTYMLDLIDEEAMIALQDKIKELTALESEVKAQIKKEMETKGIQRLISNKIAIYFNPAQENLERFDKDKFKEENPDLYDEYVKMDGKRSAYITIKRK